jgi:hypothetical protein
MNGKGSIGVRYAIPALDNAVVLASAPDLHLIDEVVGGINRR